MNFDLTHSDDVTRSLDCERVSERYVVRIVRLVGEKDVTCSI